MTQETLSPELAALAGRAAAAEQEHAQASAAPEPPPPPPPSAESLALARLALQTAGVLLARGFNSAHWLFSDAELDGMTPPWAVICDLYLPNTNSPWFAVALSTGPLIAVRIVQQRQVDAARRANPQGDTIDGTADAPAQEYGPPPAGLG